MACSLLKEIHYLNDVFGYQFSLHYLRSKDGHEIDFLVALGTEPLLCIEVKTSEASPSKHFDFFKKFIQSVQCLQLVLKLPREYDTNKGIQIRDLKSFLANLDLHSYLQHKTKECIESQEHDLEESMP